MTMAGPALSPGLSNCLVLLLLLFSAGETVLVSDRKDLYRDPEGSTCSQILQYPRFMAKKRGSTVEIKCYVEYPENSDIVTWFRKQETDPEPKLLPYEEGRISHSHNGSTFTLVIQGIQFQDNGIYFCMKKCRKEPSRTEHGCGTELRVMGFSTLAQMNRRNMLKDTIIMIQTLLIILFIIVPIFLLLDKDDSKAGMEEDHTYEGLDIDQTATYEDIVTLRTGEVKWSVGEHPGQE
ncbi:B-cell antigen receptor complex-associated protein beta chain isoform X1 [Camelus dromedarius]|uniref:B-cell antigen receptor complex-associated protein beta chain isoform X1 n=1 Tax=Camelus dromedarius TaxID=9838 RepID=UPI00057B8E47|nr:B-cell antigen receptor complex-associated protein beta chain isoform X1 [Camelus dromedarius]XP_031324740.1 B-cell antigen receptor complex-associated protein beta chain isoform X1 [Camelus dromedarius]